MSIQRAVEDNYVQVNSAPWRCFFSLVEDTPDPLDPITPFNNFREAPLLLIGPMKSTVSAIGLDPRGNHMRGVHEVT